MVNQGDGCWEMKTASLATYIPLASSTWSNRIRFLHVFLFSQKLDPRVDPIDQEFILGLDARETNPITSDCNSLSSSMLLACNILLPTCKRPSHSFGSRVSSFCSLTRKGRRINTPFNNGLGVRVNPKDEPTGIPIGQSCLKRLQKDVFRRRTAEFESDYNKSHPILLSTAYSSWYHQFQPT